MDVAPDDRKENVAPDERQENVAPDERQENVAPDERRESKLGYCANFIDRCLRRKKPTFGNVETQLHRCLGWFDVIMLGFGIMVGPAIYVATGMLSKWVAGPASFISYLLAGVVALAASFCYAELASIISEAGSAYAYTYVAAGELCAFLVGWNLILEYLTGTASAAKILSATIDKMTGDTISLWTDEKLGNLQSSWLAAEIDLLACGITLVVTIVISLGARIGAGVNNFLSVVNIAILLFMVGFGISFADFSNWSNQNHGGFMPFGLSGVMSGAAICFYGYVGFDVMTAASEEIKNPATTIPRSLIITIGLVTLLNVIVSAIFTLDTPQLDIDADAPFTSMYIQRGMKWMAIVVTVGAVLATLTTVMANLYFLPRIIYAIARDGLLFPQLAFVSSRTRVPVVSSVCCGLVSSLMALLLSINTLIHLLSIGTLFTIMFVAGSVVVIRYTHLSQDSELQLADPVRSKHPANYFHVGPIDDQAPLLPKDSERIGTVRESWRHRVPGFLLKFKAGNAVEFCTIAASLDSFLFAYGANLYFSTSQPSLRYASLLLTVFAAIVFVLFVSIICVHQQADRSNFQVPALPWLPLTTNLLIACLMSQLGTFSWIRLAIWKFLGLLIYLLYGIRSSRLETPRIEFRGDFPIHRSVRTHYGSGQSTTK